jgi:hypothetical protein
MTIIGSEQEVGDQRRGIRELQKENLNITDLRVFRNYRCQDRVIV